MMPVAPPIIHEHGHCRICPGRLRTILDLGPVAVSAFPRPGEPDSLAAPLDLCCCVQCGLVQLRHSVDSQYLYQEYWYRSGINETMVAELRAVTEAAIDWVGGVADGDVVVDIGANDGTLLSTYPGGELCQLWTIAYEPAANLLPLVSQHAAIVVPQAFPPGNHAYKVGAGTATIVTSIACFYDLDDPIGFAKEVARILHPEGVWVIQLQDLQQMLDATAFDNICHEHVTYLSLGAIQRIVGAAGLFVTQVERRAINGGSLRVFVQHEAALRRRPSVASVYDHLEIEAGCDNWVTLERFAHAVRERQRQIVAAVAHLQVHGLTVDLYGASTKANTLLQSCGLTRSVIRQAWERTPEKYGRETVGTRIPIVSEADGRVNPPDALLIGAWQFREAFVAREAEYLKAGGMMIAPLPVVEVVRWA